MSNKKIKTNALITTLTLCMALISSVSAENRPMLVPMGSTVGIEMSTDGALVVGLSATDNGASPSPAAVAGLLPGDLITAVDGEKISSASDLRAAVNNMGGKTLTVLVRRGAQDIEISLCPNFESGAAELGMWLRDSVAGIGTLTYYDPQSGNYGGLGHGINDVDSGVLMPLGDGCIMPSTITEIKMGAAGEPGELRGSFDTTSPKGTILRNTSSGIFGELYSGAPLSKAIPIAHCDEIELGAAIIFCNTKGDEIEEFQVEITRVYRGDDTGRSMMLSVTDKQLLSLTGGIVQGMSGSPIIQNGRLIGAVTHVLVNDPSRGFGISIDEMLNASCDAVRTAA